MGRARAPYSLIATGDEGSGSLSVWSSKKDRAVLVAKGCFKCACVRACCMYLCVYTYIQKHTGGQGLLQVCVRVARVACFMYIYVGREVPTKEGRLPTSMELSNHPLPLSFHPRPHTIYHNPTAAVTDFAWSKDALTLLACSRDGTVVCVAFDRSELLRRAFSYFRVPWSWFGFDWWMDGTIGSPHDRTACLD